MSTTKPSRPPLRDPEQYAKAKSGKDKTMAMGRLRSIGSSTSPAPDPLSPEEALMQKLRSGELDLPGYYDAMVELSLEHLRKHLSARQLEIVRERAREEIETNPVLVKMVQDVLAELAESAPRQEK